jgi:O-antigen biosynthesis protein
MSETQHIPVAAALSELVAKDDTEFIEAAYQQIFGRHPDASGLATYLALIRRGESKHDILRELCFSPEGVGKNAHHSGLAKTLTDEAAGGNSLRATVSRWILGERFSGIERAMRISQNKLFRLESSIKSLLSKQNNLPDAATHPTITNANTSLVHRFDAIESQLNKLTTALALQASPDNQSSQSPDSAPVPATEIFPAPVKKRDGIWEWNGYHDVKARIAEYRTSQSQTMTKIPLDLVSISDEQIHVGILAKLKLELPKPTKNPVASIIIPTFNNIRLTLECLASIARFTSLKADVEIIIADDASTDQTVQILTGIDNIRLLPNATNIGFLLNCNRAIAQARGQYVIFLNNDVQVTANWLEDLLQPFADFPKVGAVGPRYVFPDGMLQEVGAALAEDASAEMVGFGQNPDLPRYNYLRKVDYSSGACLAVPRDLLKSLGGFAEEFAPCYCEDSDLCLRIQELGYSVYVNPKVTIVHHLSKTTAAISSEFKLKTVATNLVKFQDKWQTRLSAHATPKVLAFYLPQFHPFAENSQWWGEGFTEWTNVTKAKPNFVGHYQPRMPADLGYYDLRVEEILSKQAALAKRYGIDGFCFYYYWFAGKRLMERPLEQLLQSDKPDLPFCLCWANENWSRRWDGQDQEILMAQSHTAADDIAVIQDLCRYFCDRRYIRIDGKPMLLIYRVQLFPNFAATAERWRKYCRESGIGEIYLVLVETFELVHQSRNPKEFGCDAAVEFPPMELAEPKPPSGALLNPEFVGQTANYHDLATRFATRDFPGYTRFKGVAPGWDNTARMQNRSFCFENATPGAFQAWLEESLDETRKQHSGDERLVFVNAWNEWAEGTYLEPDRRYGHAFLQAARNAKDAKMLLRKDKYQLGD